jgi:hypothetical protein
MRGMMGRSRSLLAVFHTQFSLFDLNVLGTFTNIQMGHIALVHYSVDISQIMDLLRRSERHPNGHSEALRCLLLQEGSIQHIAMKSRLWTSQRLRVDCQSDSMHLVHLTLRINVFQTRKGFDLNQEVDCYMLLIDRSNGEDVHIYSVV